MSAINDCCVSEECFTFTARVPEAAAAWIAGQCVGVSSGALNNLIARQSNGPKGTYEMSAGITSRIIRKVS